MASAILLVGFADYIDMVVDKVNLIAGSDFFAFAGLYLTVDTDEPVCDCLFGVATAFAKAFEFENLVKLDEFGFKLRDDIVWIIHT